MKTQHTPGPWHIDDLAILDSTNIGTLANINPENDGPSAEDYANAQLIATAPELLAALQRIVKATFNYEDLTQPILDAQSVIAKATTNNS